MPTADTLLVRLQDISQFIASGNLEDDLTQQAEMTAQLVGADTCSIMLLNEGEQAAPRLTVSAHYGPLPDAAWQASVGCGDGIAGHVLARGRSLLVEDIAQSDFAPLARHAEDGRRSLMLAPVRIGAKVVGMLNVCSGRYSAQFNLVDLHLLDVIALYIGKTVQVQQLQSLLNSRFAQLATLEQMRGKVDAHIAYQQPDQVARLLAKAFYKEMAKAGFASGQMVQAASEIIAQLNSNLQRHSTRRSGAPHHDGRTD
jgi:L-methionine (R)-S-oxide reductase